MSGNGEKPPISDEGTSSQNDAAGTSSAAIGNPSLIENLDSDLIPDNRGAPEQYGEDEDEGNSIETSGSNLTPTSSIIKEEEDKFYSAEDNTHGDDDIWGILSGVGGNMYEWYDFAVYGLLASEIGSCFFPRSSQEIQLMSSFGVYLAAFVMRPLGAILFGEIGDRIVGRKNALVISIILVTAPSVAMGILPGYNTLGIAAPILLVLLRMMQGLSVGGQLAGSYVLSIEQSSAANRGFRGSICDASSVGGFLVSSLVVTVVRKCYSEEAVNNWAWRIPFWFSLVLAPVLFYVVNNSKESKFWEERTLQKETEIIIREEDCPQDENRDSALNDLFSSPFRRRQLYGMVGTLSVVASSFYLIFLFTPLYLSNLRHLLSEANSDLLTSCITMCYIVMVLFAGRLSDTFPHRMDLIRIGLPGIIVAAPLMFAMFECESLFGIILAELMFAFCLALVQGGLAAWEVELWMSEPTLSFTGVAVGHNISSSIFGGTMPLISTFLFYRADWWTREDDAIWSRIVPGFYVSILGIVSLWCISSVIRHPHDVRSGELRQRRARKRAEKRRQNTTWTETFDQFTIAVSTSFSNLADIGSKGYNPPVIDESEVAKDDSKVTTKGYEKKEVV